MKLLKGFYIYVIIASIITLFNNLNDSLNPAIIVSLMGIVSSILFFSKKNNYYFLAVFWIIAQIPYLKTDTFTLDLSQFLNIHITLHFGSLSFGINAQILLLLFLKQIFLSKFLFHEIRFRAYTEHLKLKRENEYTFIPTDIISKKLVGDTEIEIDDEIYSKVEFEILDSDTIKKGGLTLMSMGGISKINATVEYKLDDKV